MESPVLPNAADKALRTAFLASEGASQEPIQMDIQIEEMQKAIQTKYVLVSSPLPSPASIDD